MAHLLGILSTHPDWLQCLLASERPSLAVPDPPVPGSHGVAFYQQGEVLLRLAPNERDRPFDFERTAREVRSTVLLGHLRRAGLGPAEPRNGQPFRFGDWTFAHSGDLPGFPAIRPRLLQNVPPFLERNLRGDTDSEVLFHLVLAHLHGAGLLRGDAAPDAVCEHLRRAVREADEAVVSVGLPVPGFAVLLTNGSLMVAACRGLPLYLRQFDRLVDCRECTAEDRRVRCGIHASDRTDLRAAMVVSYPTPMPERYERLPEEGLLAVKPDATVEAYPLRPSSVGLTGF